jgi:hypothetical protein
MTILRKSQSCDIQVDMKPSAAGILYSVSTDTDVLIADGTAVATYEKLVESYDTIRIPARFIIEFGQNVIAELLTKIR